MKRHAPAFAGALAACWLAGATAADSQANETRPQPSPSGARPHGPQNEAPRGGSPSRPPPQDSLGAGWRQQQDEVREGRLQKRLVPLPRVIDQIQQRAPGRQLDAGLEYDGDPPRAVYRVRWMTADGRRIDYMIDAATGAILSGQ